MENYKICLMEFWYFVIFHQLLLVTSGNWVAILRWQISLWFWLATSFCWQLRIYLHSWDVELLRASKKILLEDLEKLISQPYFLLFVSTAIWWLVLYSYWLKGNWMVYPLCFYQSQPVLKLQTDDDEQTNSRVLTCFLLPQQGLGSLGKYMLNVFPCIFLQFVNFVDRIFCTVLN